VTAVVSVAQLAVRDGDFAGNLALARSAAGEAAARGSDLLVLPELWLSGQALETATATALREGDERAEQLAAIARDSGMMVAGSVLAAASGRPRNRLMIHDSMGKVVATYDKVHLFGLMAEDRHLAPGDRAVVADLGWCRAGLAICYDLRFPDLFGRLVRDGADVVIIPAAWPRVRIAHWLALVRARAIESQLYVVACNRTGEHAGMEFGGHSLVVDPWGDVLHQSEGDPGMFTVTLDLARVAEVRASLPVAKDRRPDVYGPP